MLIHVQTQHKWDAHLPQLQQFVGSDLPLWKNSQTDCASGASTSVSLRCPSDAVGEGTGKGGMERCPSAACGQRRCQQLPIALTAGNNAVCCRAEASTPCTGAGIGAVAVCSSGMMGTKWLTFGRLPIPTICLDTGCLSAEAASPQHQSGSCRCHHSSYRPVKRRKQMRQALCRRSVVDQLRLSSVGICVSCTTYTAPQPSYSGNCLGHRLCGNTLELHDCEP